jgi:hypothetical protein
MNYRLLLYGTLISVSIFSCRRKNDISPELKTPTADSVSIIDTEPAFIPSSDTLPGNVYRSTPSSLIFDSPLYFYVNHFTKDSLIITSNATFSGDNNGGKFTVNIPLKINDSSIYHLYGRNYDLVRFKKDSLLFVWRYAVEPKMPLGGERYGSCYAYGKKIRSH